MVLCLWLHLVRRLPTYSPKRDQTIRSSSYDFWDDSSCGRRRSGVVGNKLLVRRRG